VPPSMPGTTMTSTAPASGEVDNADDAPMVVGGGGGWERRRQRLSGRRSGKVAGNNGATSAATTTAKTTMTTTTLIAEQDQMRHHHRTMVGGRGSEQCVDITVFFHEIFFIRHFIRSPRKDWVKLDLVDILY